MNNIKIKKASPSDASNITYIVDTVLFKNINTNRNGFLMSNLGEKKYKELINNSNYTYIASANNKNVGFLIAYTSDLMMPRDDIHKYFIKNYSQENYIYIFQLAIIPEFQRKGLGRKLYEKLFSDSKELKKMVVTSAIPHNKASEKFHLNLGFKKIDKLTRDDGGSNFVYEFMENN